MVHRRPVDGIYRSIQILDAADSIQPLAFPDISINVAEILA